MLFNSFVFLYAFLQLTIALYYTTRRRVGHDYALDVLTLASLVYYGWWDVRYLVLLLGSAFINFAVGRSLWRKRRKWVMVAGILFNVSVLAFFKYADFALANISAISGTALQPLGIVLPIGISFITFQKIAFLADVYAGKTEPRSLISYVLFVSFFPQLIAGPIVHHRQIAVQFGDRNRKDDIAANLSIGLSIFIVGLAKKILLADNAAIVASAVFAAAERGNSIPLGAAWVGALSYALQIFFDFSGYSDMALGLGRMFGYHLPINFNAPYRATSIIEFWRRWHITLSQFLRDYIYFPLGGNRLGEFRRYLNLMVVMLVGGLWHGASWTFVVWGGLHGVYLIVNHLWRGWRGEGPPSRARAIASTIVTFISVVFAWVFFRAGTFAGAFHMLGAMAGTQTIGWGVGSDAVTVLVAGYGLIYLLPDTPQLFAATLEPHVLATANIDTGTRAALLPLRWQFQWFFAAAAGTLLLVVLINLSKTSEFIYYQF